jgi:type VI secretion system protein VasJ
MVEPSALAGLGRTPIPGDQPAGEYAADDTEFEEIRAEVLKDPVREITDWGRVVPRATQILERRSKDFTAGAYLTAGLLETKGYPGLLDGLAILTGLHETFWDNGFPPVPKRLRGRANAIQWLVERCGTWIERKGAQPADRDTIAACLQVCGDLEKTLGERFTEGDVGAGGILRALREQFERLPSPEEAAAAPVAGAATNQAASSATPVASSGDLEIRSQSDAQLLIFKMAAFLRQKEPASPTPYRLVRVFRWAGIGAAPPTTDGKTQIIPPSAETNALLHGAYDARNWSGLLESAEDAFRQGSPLWLDVQRFTVTALENLGPGFAAIREGVLEEVRGLLRRIPSLPELHFRDDSPFADPETRVWLAESLGQEAAGGGAPRSGSASAPVAEGIDPAALAEARTEAMRLVKDGDFRGALDAIAAAVTRPGSPRGDFLVRLEVATLCADLGRDRLALPMLQALDDTVRAHDLETWEPALATRVLESMYRATKRQAGQRGATPDLAGRVEEFFARLCRIDPGTAAKID